VVGLGGKRPAQGQGAGSACGEPEHFTSLHGDLRRATRQLKQRNVNEPARSNRVLIE